MKKKCTFSCFGCLWLPLLLLLNGCTAGEEKKPWDDVEDALTYDWSLSQDNDTTWLICHQIATYTDESGQTKIASFKASVKLWPEKQTINFGTDKNPQPQFVSNTEAKDQTGTLPTVKTVRKNFLFDDGQTVIAEICIERFVFPTFYLPYVDISDVTFETATAEQTGNANTYATTLVFSALWQKQPTNPVDKGSMQLLTEYTKIRSEPTDELLSVDYAQNYKWTGNNVTLLVEKTEVWSASGTKKHVFESPALAFSLSEKANTVKRVKNFDFAGTLSTDKTDVTDISSEDWTLQQGSVVNRITFTNGEDEFSETFVYPFYTASYTLDGKKFIFDLNVSFHETHHVTVIDDNNAQSETIAEATLLEHSLSCTATTALAKVN